MIWVQWLVLAFSILALGAMVAGTLAVRFGGYPRRPVAVFIVGLCAVTALVNLFGFTAWPALPWALSSAAWSVYALRRSA